MALEWLKTILGDAYTEEIDKKVSEEIGKGFVSKADFNATNSEVKALKGQIADRDKQLGELKKVDASKLQEEIDRLTGENKQKDADHEKALMQLRVDAAVDKAITEAKGKNAKAIKALLDLEDAKLSDDGSIKGLSEQIKALTEADDSKMLFGETKNIKGASMIDGDDDLETLDAAALDAAFGIEAQK